MPASNAPVWDFAPATVWRAPTDWRQHYACAFTMSRLDLPNHTRPQLQSLLTQIGKTPLRTLSLSIDGAERLVYLKMEGANPAGSIKDRTAYSLVCHLESSGMLGPGKTLVDSTSGNLGVALAFITKAKGYGFIAVVDPRASTSSVDLMRRLGAEVQVADSQDKTGNYLLARLERVRQLCESTPSLVWANQYSNPANPRAHFSSTAPELLEQVGGSVDAIFVPVSTGGTLAGIGRYVRCSGISTRIIAVDAVGSLVFSDQSSPRRLTGIGSSRKSDFITRQMYDDFMLVSDAEAFSHCRFLHSETGLKVGGSTGAVLAACSSYLELHPEIGSVVCMSADYGDAYEDTIYNDAWVQQIGDGSTSMSLGSLSRVNLLT
jgi:N-(2-amino-2-carboxyethyl)-L-glutamate synthase